MAFALADGISWPLGGESGRCAGNRPHAMAGDPRRKRADCAHGFPRSNSFEPFRLRRRLATKVGTDRNLTMIIAFETAH